MQQRGSLSETSTPPHTFMFPSSFPGSEHVCLYPKLYSHLYKVSISTSRHVESWFSGQAINKVNEEVGKSCRVTNGPVSHVAVSRDLRRVPARCSSGALTWKLNPALLFRFNFHSMSQSIYTKEIACEGVLQMLMSYPFLSQSPGPVTQAPREAVFI